MEEITVEDGVLKRTTTTIDTLDRGYIFMELQRVTSELEGIDDKKTELAERKDYLTELLKEFDRQTEDK